MADRIKSKPGGITSTPDPRRKLVNKKLFNEKVSPVQELSSQVKKSNMIELVISAIKAVGLFKKGASLPAIKKWVIANREPTARYQNFVLKKAIEKGLESGILIRAPHSKDAHGICGSFMLPKTSKKTKHSPNQKVPNKKIPHTSKVNDNPKSSKTDLNLNTAKNINKVKKKESKNALLPQKEIAKNEGEKILPRKRVAKKGTKRNPVSSSEVSEGAKNTETTKVTAKKALISKHPFPPKENESLTSSSDSSSSTKNGKTFEQETELTKQKVNKTKELKQNKPIKSKQPKVKTVPKSTVEETENSAKVIQRKKLKENESNIKNITKQSKTNQGNFKENRSPTHNGNKMQDIKSNKNVRAERNALDVTRNGMSDTEIDTRLNQTKPKKSYASDTELEISKRNISQAQKKLKRKKQSRK